MTAPEPVAPPQHLWEFDHPYRCEEGNFYRNGCHVEYGSWQAHQEAEGDADLDWNLVYRWDWEPVDYLEDDSLTGLREYAARFGDRDHAWKLTIFWMGQRKALARSTSALVCKADEPAVRAWLALRAEHVLRVWAPLLDGALTEETPDHA